MTPLPSEGPVLLRRSDPAQNMHRFYRLDLSADLFGGVQLTRRWGRIGTQGQSLTRWCQTAQEALDFADMLLTAKIRRGYALSPAPARPD